MDISEQAFDAGFNGTDIIPEPAVAPVPEPVADPTPALPDVKGDGAPAAEDVKPEQGKVFTQAELDTIVEKRLSREKTVLEKQLKSHPVVSYVERVAQQNGMTVEAVLAAWQQQEIERVADQQGIPPEAAKRLVEAEAKAGQLETQLKTYRTAEEKQVSDQKEFAVFVNAFPDVNANAIPAEVWAAHAGGKSLVDAYKEHTTNLAITAKDTELKTLKDRLAVLEQQVNNKNRAPISGGTGAHGSVALESEDPFLRGFDSV